MGLDVMWNELKQWIGNGDGTGCGLSSNCGLGMEMGLDVMWTELEVWFGNRDGTGCDVD